MGNSYSSRRVKSATAIFCGMLLCCSIFAQTNLGWIQRAGFPGPARHRASAAAVGNRGYMGLGHINAVTDILYDDWFEYDPGTDSWMQKASYPGGPRMHAATFVINNKIYVGTGRDLATNLHVDFWCYDPVTNSWSSIADYPGAGRRGAVAFTLNGMGYVGTGSYHSNFFRYDPATDTWLQTASLPGTGRISAVGFAINNMGYLTTGDDGAATGDMWEYDPNLDTWTQRANLPGLPRMEACGFALDGKGFVGTGDDFSSGTNYQDFWCFDPLANSWIQVTDFAGDARRYMSSFVIGHRAYTGLGTSGINYADLWEYGTISGIETTGCGGNEMQVFPNPISVSATIQFGMEVHQANLKLMDMNGKLLRNYDNVSGNQLTFFKNELKTGTYILLLQEGEKQLAISKLMIE